MINQKDVKQVAKLARIELSEQEKEKFAKELSLILDYINQLKELNTENIEPTAQIAGLKNVLRQDQQENNLNNQDKIISQFPEKKDTLLKVKAILEK